MRISTENYDLDNNNQGKIITPPVCLNQTTGDEIKKEKYSRRTRKLLETKLYSRNFIEIINFWSVLLVRSLIKICDHNKDKGFSLFSN